MTGDEKTLMEFPGNFSYSRFLFRLQLKERTILPAFKGSVLRGMMGKALYRLNCRTTSTCARCAFVTDCPYSRLFKPELIFKNQLTTPPFVLFSPNKKRNFNKGDEIKFYLTLFGDFTIFFDFFLKAFDYARGFGLGKRRTPYDVVSVADDISGELIYSGNKINDGRKPTKATLSSLKPQTLKHLKLEFCTPIFLKANKQPILQPTMDEILVAIIRRIHIFSRSIWKDAEFTIDRAFVRNFKFHVDRYDLDYRKSYKKGGLGHNVDLSGFTGTIELSGALDRLYPIFKAGEILHIGARTSYGLGKYRLVTD